MRHVVAWIDTQLTEQITLDQIAAHARCSEYHFARVFRKHVGMPVLAYVRHRRLLFAARALSDGRRIRDIADIYGYENASSFSRAFRNAYGYSPTEYRDLLKSIHPCGGSTKTSTEMTIRPVDDLRVLRHAYDLADLRLRLASVDEMPYTYEFFRSELNSGSRLLLYGELGAEIVGVAFGRVGLNNHVTLALVVVDERFERRGYGTALVEAFVARCREGGHPGIALGSNEGADEFFAKCGFTATLFLQSKRHALEELRSINDRYRELWGLEQDENGWCRLMLDTPSGDEELRRRYDELFEDCIPQTVFRMSL